MLGKVAREAKQRHGHVCPALGQFRFRINAAFAKTLEKVRFAVEPVVGLRYQVDDGRVNTERLAGVAQCAARPVGCHRGSQCCAVPAILSIQVLDHFLAALVLEVDVDIGRLRALFGDEPFEQKIAACRVNFGDAETVADGRIGCGTATLAENAVGAGEPNDVVDRQHLLVVGVWTRHESRTWLGFRGFQP
ncbi:hypothetical protein D9M68_343930 [compost metagenome]